MCAVLSIQITSSYFSVEDIDREPPARDPEDRRFVEEAGEALGVQSGAGHQHLQVRSEPGDVLNETKQDVCVERSLVGFIYDDHTGGRKRERGSLSTTAARTSNDMTSQQQS